MEPLEIMLTELAHLAACHGLERVEIHVTISGQDFVIGYGEAGEPAILSASYPAKDA